MLYPVIFILILFIFTALCIIRINILIEYLRDGIDDHIIISFYILSGKLKLKYEIPFIDIEKRGIKFRKYKEMGKKEADIKKDKGRFNFSDIFEKIKFFKRYYEENKGLICNICNYLKRRLVLKELNIDIEFGTGSAFYTGLFSGVVWTIIGIFTSYMANSFKTYKKCANVKPDFVNEKFKVDLYCIFTVKTVHIIVVGVKIILYILSKKISIKNTIGGGLVG